MNSTAALLANAALLMYRTGVGEQEAPDSIYLVSDQGCVFRPKLDTDSGANWTPNPAETGQRFRRKLDTDSGLKLDSLRRPAGIA